ncbi:hypothetical protein L1987_88324 [Smallanthus sonchifolius]|nr:hypothetical protein L1987_88324 [Smallanthus sonchifolius]
MNRRLNLDIPQNNTFLLPRDILAAADRLIRIKFGMGTLDDMNHLQNKRIRSVADLLQEQFGLALVRLENMARGNIYAALKHNWTPTPQNLGIQEEQVVPARYRQEFLTIAWEQVHLRSNGDTLRIPLVMYQRSNKNTCMHQKPQVRRGKCIKKGQILAYGAATVGGELALGKNVLVAYMPWEGYNFEDAVLISERLVYEDIYTSFHILDDKIHGRSSGRYSRLTQQPLKGRAKKGGQRVGEMEVWALEGFGVAYILQEMLTYKSDHIRARQEVLGTIIFGGRIPTPEDAPESFRLFVRELRSLALELNHFLVSEKTFQLNRKEA